MEISARFLTLLGHQLAQFSDRPDLRSLVVYLALPGGDGKPGLIPVGTGPATIGFCRPLTRTAACNCPAPSGVGCPCVRTDCCWEPCGWKQPNSLASRA